MAALSHYIGTAISALRADPAAAAATVGGTATAYAGFTAMDYNKDNFMIDQENRFGRFTAARANMMAQVGQYRMDIRGLANVTIAKCHCFLDTAQLFMCVSAALTCAGRVGMHGAAPPGWLMALYTGNIFTGAMYLIVCMWLGFHAGLRAQCGMVSLLTRKVRLPIPSLSQINQSRQFGSGYERQRWWDILRFPWVPHPFDPPEIPENSSEEEEGGSKDKKGSPKKAKRSKAHEGRGGDYAASEVFASTGRTSVPSWIRDEQVVDKANASVPHHVPQFKGDVQLHNSSDPHDAPDHFKLFMEAQKEWFPYEVYHRIALLFGVCCFFHAVCYYCVITAMSELRAFWIGWAIPGLFMAAQYWIMQLDIFKSHGQQFLRGFEWFGHIAPYFATAACTCEFRFQYSKAQVALAWTFAMAALGSHLLFACRFFDLMTPDTMSKEMEEEDGKSWWPKKWVVPLAFANTSWLLTPPKKLKKGQHDLLHEALNLERQNGGICKVRRRRGKDPATVKKRTKRATPQNPRVLMNQVRDLDDRFRSVWQEVVGKDQTHLNELYGRWHQAKEEATTLLGHTGGFESGSGGSGTDTTGGSSDGYAGYAAANKGGEMRHAQYADKITEVADDLHHIEDSLAQLEQKHAASDEPKPAEIGMSTGVNLEQGGTTTRGLPTTPYWIMRSAVTAHIFCWAFIMVCTGVEIVLGTESLSQPPGEPPWIRNMKMRVYTPEKEYLHLSKDPLPSWYRLFVAASIPDADTYHHASASGGSSASHGSAASTSGSSPSSAGADASHASAAGTDTASHGSAADAGSASAGEGSAHDSAGSAHAGGRRLTGGKAEAFSELLSTLPALDWLAEKYLQDDTRPDWQTTMQVPSGVAGMPTTMEEEIHQGMGTTSVPGNGFMATSLRALPVEWPALFEPRHLACQTRATGTSIAALTSRGFGALLHIKNNSDVLEIKVKAEQFALAGIGALGPLVGTSWGTSGLHLVTKAGRLVHCPGHAPTDGAWHCTPDTGAPVPMSPGATLRAGTVTAHPTTGRTLALLFEDTPKTVVLYKEDATRQAWLPAGEMHLPPGSSHGTLSMTKDELMVVLEDGAVHHRPLHERASPSFIPAPASSVAREWHSACPASPTGEGVVRLALRQSGPHAATAWVPELVVTAKLGASPTPLLEV